MDFIFDLVGRFHPLIVHLPIGFLLMGLMMFVFDRKENKYQKIITFAFFWASLSTLFAVITERVIRGRIFRDICFWGFSLLHFHFLFF